MIQRLALTLLIILSGIAAYRLYLWISLRRRARSARGLEGFQLGRPAILYFSAPGCGPCIAVQDPALEELSAQAKAKLQIIKIDALEQPDLADSWGVLSVPTTFLIDSKGRPRRVNNGAVRASRLREQLAEIGEQLPDARAREQLYNQEAQSEVEV